MGYSSEIHALLGAAAADYDNPATTAILERAIRLAQTHRDLDLEFEAKLALVRNADFIGRHDLALATYPWLLQQVDAYPERFDRYSVLWQYKWMISALVHFPAVSRAQIEGAYNDLKSRYEQYGEPMKTLYYLAYDLYYDLGDLRRAAELYAQFKATPERRGALMDCRACVTNTEVHYLEGIGEWEAALAKAKPILAGTQSCHSVPQSTYSKILSGALLRGDLETAEAAYRKGIRLLKPALDDLGYFPSHMLYNALAGGFTKALSLFGQGAPLAAATRNMTNRFYFALAASVLFRRLAQNGRKIFLLTFPEDHPLYTESRKVQVEDAALHYSEDAAALAAGFDARNGNSRHRERLNQYTALADG